MSTTRLSPIHPGLLLAEDLRDMNISARDTAMPFNWASELVHSKRAIAAGSAYVSRPSPEYWLNSQTAYDLATVQEQTVAPIKGKVRHLSA